MRFSIFESAKAQRGAECTYEKFLEVSSSKELLATCKDIAAATDDEERANLKKRLPVITWQAYFAGRRVAKEAEPSGLFMLDLDHVERPFEVYSKQIASRIKELGIVFVGMTASQHGLRIVAKCLPTLNSIEACQRWLAGNLKVEYDGVCKDWARCSFVVHESYTYYMDAQAIWQEEAAVGTLYAGGKNPVQENTEMAAMTDETATQPEAASDDDPKSVDQREGLFGGQTEYKGLPLKEIAQEWLEQTGGMPEKGERNARLYKLATRIRFITDFNAQTMLRVMPTCGLSETERKGIIHSALGLRMSSSMPRDLESVIDNMLKRKELAGDVSQEEIPEVITDTNELPPFPPVIRQYVDTAPTDFKAAVALCQLPILGALGSRLRAQYLDGKLHSPSFLVSLEAPQASGKSFMRTLVQEELAQMLEHDEMQREKEREYDAKVKELKLLNTKVNKTNKDEVLGAKPKTLIRFVPATMSITKMLMRMYDAQGLHLFAFAEEVDTVTKAFKRGFSSYSDLLRVGFDNGLFGQDYASENSFSGIIPIYYNMLCSGTPKAMRRFYPDVEDGLVSRVCFVTLPDQFGRPMPEWKEMTKAQRQTVDLGLVRLNEVTLRGDEVCPEYEMKMDWLNEELKKWLVAQQQEAVRSNDRTRDIFCRRSAVVGFRAGMLAWFLWGEKNTPMIKRNVIKFSTWIANSMLNQHLLRFEVQGTGSNTNPYEKVLVTLKEEFTRDELIAAMESSGVSVRPSMLIYRWKLANLIEVLENDPTDGRMKGTRFRKIKN